MIIYNYHNNFQHLTAVCFPLSSSLLLLSLSVDSSALLPSKHVLHLLPRTHQPLSGLNLLPRVVLSLCHLFQSHGNSGAHDLRSGTSNLRAGSHRGVSDVVFVINLLHFTYSRILRDLQFVVHAILFTVV